MALTRMAKLLPVELVFSEDPEVRPLDPLSAGWMPKSMAVVAEGADVVMVRSLTMPERNQALDAGGWHSQHYRMAELGVVAVNGSKRAGRQWLLEVAPSVTALLGVWIERYSDGLDPKDQRAIMAAVNDTPEPVVTARVVDPSEPADADDGDPPG